MYVFLVQCSICCYRPVLSSGTVYRLASVCVCVCVCVCVRVCARVCVCVAIINGVTMTKVY